MASKGNRVLKVKTDKARKMDREKGRALKYTTKNTPEGTAGVEKLPSKADVNLARKDKKITRDEAAEYTREIDEYNENRAKKSSGGAIRGVKPEEKRSADVALDRPLRVTLPEPKQAQVKRRAEVKVTKKKSKGDWKEVKKGKVIVEQPSKYELEGVAQSKASIKLTKRAEGLGIVPGMSGGSRKIVESELGDVQKKSAAKGRRRSEKEVEAGVLSSIAKDKDLKPGQLTSAEKIYVKSGFGVPEGKTVAPHVKAARDAEVAKQEKEAKIRKARGIDVSYDANKAEIESDLKRLPKSAGTRKRPGVTPRSLGLTEFGASSGTRPVEREVSIAPNEAGIRITPTTERKMGRKLRYNIVKSQKKDASEGYTKAAAGSEIQAKATNKAKQKKFKNTQKRSLAVARNVDSRRDEEKQALLTAAESLGNTKKEKKEKARLTQKAHSLIRPEKEDIMGKGGRIIASGVQLGPEVKRTIVDPNALDKKYTRVVPLGAPRMMERIKNMGPVSIKSGSNTPVTDTKRMEKLADPKVASAGNKAPKLEIVPLKSPDKTTGLLLRGSHDEALYSVSKHVFGEKNALKNMKHVRTFALDLSKKNRHLGGEQALVSGMLGVLNKGIKPKTDQNAAEHKDIDTHAARINTLKSSIKAHAKEAKGRAALKAEERAGKIAQIKAEEKEQNT